MADKVEGKESQLEPCLFHFSLVKLLVLEELRKIDISWQTFVDSSKLVDDFPTSPLIKRETPSLVVNEIKSPAGSSV